MKKAVIFAGAAGLVWLAASVLRGDKRLLMKASQELIDLASAPAPPSDIAILKRVEKMARHLHFDIQFQAELDGRVYEGRSLNEARSFLMGWLKSESGRAAGKTSPQSGAGPRFEAKGLAVRLLPPNPPSDIQADRAGPLEKPAAPQRSGSSRQAVPTNKRAETSLQASFQANGRSYKSCLVWLWTKEKKWRIKTAKAMPCDRRPQ